MGLMRKSYYLGWEVEYEKHEVLFGGNREIELHTEQDTACPSKEPTSTFPSKNG
jgi:hypothetical protein